MLREQENNGNLHASCSPMFQLQVNFQGRRNTFRSGELRSKIIKSMPMLYKAHMLACETWGVWGYVPRKFCKFTLSEIESENISGL